MPLPYMSFEEQWEWIKPVWRVLVVVLLAQLVGMAMGLQNNIARDTFLNLWYGGAYATPIGFVLGLLWHWHAVPSGLMANRTILLILGIMSLALPVFGLLTYDMWQLPVAR